MELFGTPADVIEGRALCSLVEGDAADVVPTFPQAAFNAMITDPPAGIAFMAMEWDDFRRSRNPADAGRDSVGGRFSRSAPEVGRGDRERFVAWLASILGHARACMRPGARSLVWSIPKTSHWTGWAVEDAGWSIETEINHLFGQGWPKGKSQLKPAHEGWKLARNGPSTPLNIDDCRVGVGAGGSREGEASAVRRYTADGVDFAATPGPRGGAAAGRWPATVELSHTPWCQCVGTRRVASAKWGLGERRNTGIGYGGGAGGAVTASHEEKDGTEVIAAWQCVEGCPVLALDRESGETKGGERAGGGSRPAGFGNVGASKGTAIPVGRDYPDTGTASRFFAQHPAVDPDEPDPFIYATKVPAAERWCLARCGCGERVMLLDEARKTCVTDKPVGDEPARSHHRCVACGLTREHTVHPTQKSVALMRRFVRLVTKPGDVILDCFGGSMTTAVAALLEGRRVVIVEKDPRFVRIGQERLRATRLPMQLPLAGLR